MYRIFDITLDCDIPLPELPKCDPSENVIKIQSYDQSKLKQEHITWLHDWQDQNNETYFSCGRIDDNYILKFPDLAEFLISEQGSVIQYMTKSGIPTETIRHLLLDQVIPRVLGQQGRPIIHASVVVLQNDKCVAFLGGSGWGKSTIASSFITNGGRLITDDCLLIDTDEEEIIIGIPNYFGLRLYEDSAKAIFNKQYELSNVAHYTDKKRIVFDNQDSNNFPSNTKLDAIFFLEDPNKQSSPDTVSIIPLKGANKFVALFEQIFLLDITDKELISNQYRNVGKLISADIPTYRIDYPRRYSSLTAVQENIIKMMS